MPRNRRRATLSGATSMPLYVLAGLPPDIHNWARGHLQRLRPIAQVIAVASSRQDGVLLYPKQLVSTLLASVAGFAMRHRTRGPASPPRPKSITLLYVPSQDAERLLRAFDFAVIAGPLTTLQAYGENGRQFRHERVAVEKAIDDAIGRTGQPKLALDEIAQRIGRLTDREALLLPPRNFHLEEGRLERLFIEFRQSQRPINDRFVELDLARIGPRADSLAYVDGRKVAFFTARAYHGFPREIREPPSERDLQSVLRSLYRFGAPLLNGFHHDAHPRDGGSFQDFEFDCERDGRVAVTASHANIYPNDFVRAAQKRQII